MASARTINVELPADLPKRAQRSTGAGVTATIRRGLELVASAQAQDDLRKMRGKVRFSVDFATLREDRE